MCVQSYWAGWWSTLRLHYRCTRFLSSLRLARARVMTPTIPTGACDVASCVRLRDLASNAVDSLPAGSLRSFDVPPCCGTAVDGRWDVPPCICLRDLVWNCGGRTVRRDETTSGKCVVPLQVVVAVAVLILAVFAVVSAPARGGVSGGGGGGGGCG
jgi:hypothetical protein